MRLSRIKLAGFKSFVDPTVLKLTSSLTAVVGPNGSGKSNIIDAVRWVMGESSAKHLRGGAMADVIFNGSASRKPVSQASVELVFDNSDGRLGGAYARYAEISVKRVVNREGQSTYYLNGSRCRRRDITDLFLGTGLGPRSYAIIEQGMITRLIEARPEELRAIIEEAAGISKYKERRRETETRIRHTQENLSRLKDIQEEVEKQLEKLRRQARTAERYKALREEQRRLAGERLALEWRELSRQAEDQRRRLATVETEREQAMARLREIERTLEETRQRREVLAERFNEVQARFYQSGAELSAHEQALKHGRERLQHLENEAARLGTELEAARRTVEEDRLALERLSGERERLRPELDTLRGQVESLADQLEEVEAAWASWQCQWEGHTREAAEPRRQAEVARTRIEQLEQRLEELEQRRQHLESEAERLDLTSVEEERRALEKRLAECRQRREALEATRARLREQLRAQREALETLVHRRDALHRQRHGLEGRMEALRALQEQQTDEAARAWLEAQGLSEAPTVLELLEVEPGWERAVETVLGRLLQARVTETFSPYLATLTETEMAMDVAMAVHGDRERGGGGLAGKVIGPRPVVALLETIHPVDDPAELPERWHALGENESLITPQGLWLAQHWLRVDNASEQGGVLARAQELRALEHDWVQTQEALQSLEQELETARQALSETEVTEREVDEERQQVLREITVLEGQVARLRAREEQMTARRTELQLQAEEAAEHRERLRQALGEARTELAQALEAMEQAHARGEGLEAQGEALRDRRQEYREALRQYQGRLQELELQWQRLITQIQAREEGLSRAERRLEEHQARRRELERELNRAGEPLAELEARVEAALEERARLEAELAEARASLEEEEILLREGERSRHQAETMVEHCRERLDEARLTLQGFQLRLEGVAERLQEDGHAREALLEHLPEEADLDQWDRRLQEVAGNIERLGPINLAAIDEHRELSERKGYLDAQRSDLEEALATLENAMAKIDRETRARFKATFDEINSGLKDLFPRLFGGGQAYLELLETDLLESGIGIMARPPGKRISNIHLLSGGEKALTAVALVFAIFQLNPAPFCMLDEVDAPLDEANVGRFCRLVQEMSQRVQFIIISHNKATMEIAEQLHGVTMQEAGVSRLVSVDMVEAVQLAAV